MLETIVNVVHGTYVVKSRAEGIRRINNSVYCSAVNYKSKVYCCKLVYMQLCACNATFAIEIFIFIFQAKCFLLIYYLQSDVDIKIAHYKFLCY